MKVSIFGLGYVGCVTAGCLAKGGHEVIGVDVMSAKVDKLAAGKPTVVETGLEELITKAHKQGRMTATANPVEAVQETDASIICVGTPTGSDGVMDLGALRQTAKVIGEAMQKKMEDHVVILRSTVPPGTCENVVLPALHPGSPIFELFQQSELVIVPEFLREGSAIADFYDPPFIVVGSASGVADRTKETVEGLFGGIKDPLQWVPFREAEMLKGVCNCFHALKVAFANEIGALAATLSVDGQLLMKQFAQDQKLNISPAYLLPGLPFGGSCLPKDLRMLVHLANRAGVDLPLLRSILTSNEAHLKRVIETVPKNGHPRIGLNGLAFKIGTDDLRESPMVLIAEHLIGKGYDLKIYDPAIETSLITGTNREYIEQHIPHLSSRLAHNLDDLIGHSEVLVITRDGDRLLQRVAELGKRPMVVDLQGPNHLMRRWLEAKRRAKPAVTPELREPGQGVVAGAWALPTKVANNGDLTPHANPNY